jgi:hypothetical protein
MQEVPPLDLNELLAYFLKQSGPLFDHFGIKRGTGHDYSYMISGLQNSGINVCELLLY